MVAKTGAGLPRRVAPLQQGDLGRQDVPARGVRGEVDDVDDRVEVDRPIDVREALAAVVRALVADLRLDAGLVDAEQNDVVEQREGAGDALELARGRAVDEALGDEGRRGERAGGGAVDPGRSRGGVQDQAQWKEMRFGGQ
jgi:hypothetical protein